MRSVYSREPLVLGSFNEQVKLFRDSVRPPCTLAFRNHCGLSPGITQPRVVFTICKTNALTSMNCSREYGLASPAPLTETLNWLVSRVFSRTFTTFRGPTREEPVASANDFSSYVYDEIMRVILRAAGNRARVTLKTYRNETRRNLSPRVDLAGYIIMTDLLSLEALKVDKYIIAPI